MRRIMIAPLVAAPLLALLLAGCSSQGAPRPSASKGASQGIEADAFDWDVSFASCMRGQGIDVPDPTLGSTQPTKTQVDDAAAYEKVYEKCTADTTKERGDRPITEKKRGELDQWNTLYGKTADCLRKKGYTVDIDDGGYSSDDDISEADSKECAAPTSLDGNR